MERGSRISQRLPSCKRYICPGSSVQVEGIFIKNPRRYHKMNIKNINIAELCAEVLRSYCSPGKGDYEAKEPMGSFQERMGNSLTPIQPIYRADTASRSCHGRRNTSSLPKDSPGGEAESYILLGLYINLGSFQQIAPLLFCIYSPILCCRC